MMLDKIQDGDPSLSNQQALDYALHAKNMETNNKGFSAYQIVFGCNPTIPGIINSTPASLEDNFISKDIKKHISNLHLARDAFRKADNSERVKRMLKSRIHPSNNQILQPGDIVSFKEINKNKWSGPGKILGVDGKVAHIKYGNMLRRVHASKIIKHGEECFDEIEIESDNKNNKDGVESDENKEAEQVDIETTPENSRMNEEETSEISEKDPVKEFRKQKRKTSLKKPFKLRKVQFKMTGDTLWKEGEVLSKKYNDDDLKCFLKTNDGNEIQIDFSNKQVEWQYSSFSCPRCNKKYPTEKGLLQHKNLSHKNDKYNEKKLKPQNEDNFLNIWKTQ